MTPEDIARFRSAPRPIRIISFFAGVVIAPFIASWCWLARFCEEIVHAFGNAAIEWRAVWRDVATARREAFRKD